MKLKKKEVAAILQSLNAACAQTMLSSASDTLRELDPDYDIRLEGDEIMPPHEHAGLALSFLEDIRNVLLRATVRGEL